MFGLATLVLATPIDGGERTKRTIPYKLADGGVHINNVMAKRQFTYRYGGHDRDRDRDREDKRIAKRQFSYGYGGHDGDRDKDRGDKGITKRQFSYEYGDSAEPTETDLSKRTTNPEK